LFCPLKSFLFVLLLVLFVASRLPTETRYTGLVLTLAYIHGRELMKSGMKL
jgi:hypothetical protein